MKIHLISRDDWTTKNLRKLSWIWFSDFENGPAHPPKYLLSTWFSLSLSQSEVNRYKIYQAVVDNLPHCFPLMIGKERFLLNLPPNNRRTLFRYRKIDRFYLPGTGIIKTNRNRRWLTLWVYGCLPPQKEEKERAEPVTISWTSRARSSITAIDGTNGRDLSIQDAVQPESIHLPRRQFFCKFAICTLKRRY